MSVLDQAISVLEAAREENDDRLKDDILLLRMLLEFAPGKVGVAEDIVNSVKHSEHGNSTIQERVRKLSEWWLQCLFLPMKSRWGGLLPHPFRGLCEATPSEIESTSRDDLQKEKCLKRDDYSCVVTGYFDSKVFQQSKDLATKARELGVTAKTECAYIVPHSYNSFNSRSEERGRVSAWHALELFAGSEDIEESLRGSNINGVENALTMTRDIHAYFGDLDCWFEGRIRDGVFDHSYVWKHASTGVMPAGTHDGKIIYLPPNPRTPDIPPPSPLLLKLHGSVARILHLSGRGEELDQLWRDYESLKVLREDGSSADVLGIALLLLELCVSEGVSIHLVVDKARGDRESHTYRRLPRTKQHSTPYSSTCWSKDMLKEREIELEEVIVEKLKVSQETTIYLESYNQSTGATNHCR